MRLLRATAILMAMLWPGLVVATPPIDAFGQLPTLGDIALSPDGTRWAAIVGSATGSEVQVREITTGKLLLASPAKDLKLRALQWADNDRIVLTISQTTQLRSEDYLFVGRGEYYQLTMHDLATHSWRRLMNNIPLTGNFVSGTPVVRTVEGRPQLIAEGWSMPGSMFLSTVFRIDPATGRTTVVEKGNAETGDWLIGLDGEPVARSDYARENGEWRLMLRRGKNWSEVYREKALLDRPYLAGLGRTPGTIMVGTHKSGKYEVHEVNLADGTWSAPLGKGLGDGFLRDPASLQPIGVYNEGLGTVGYDFWNPDDQKLWRAIARSFKDEMVKLVDWSHDRNIVMLEVFGPKSGDAIYVVDRTSRTAGLLSPRYARLEGVGLGTVQTLTYKAADGTEIPAYLTLPPGRLHKNLPLIALPHGGPEASDSPGFDWWAQALASRGYAVLQPQFRGSSGFGAEHRDAGYGQWGRKMQTDVSDGVRHLAGLGTIDPKRVCIVGASYGGYAALAGVTVEQGVYRCASSIAGVSDLRRMLQREVSDSGGKKNPVVRYWQRFMGAENANDTKIDPFSPARLADKVTVPLQLIHGKDDLVVPMEQSNFMVSAMKNAGKPVEMVVLPSEDHWLSRPATRIAMLQALAAFLEKHNPPDPAAAVAPPPNPAAPAAP
ncbi:S9 family peptidase [Sandarakinorhabdus sp.]|uniref:alpha/beta hydrolase family protein n=1 Tax=Sandarakinorhabdus sp. TaxID=1916663 RepID=UPI00286E7488|nr:S9 family peptidase [Sandarakinorhabdus sp.]